VIKFHDFLYVPKTLIETILNIAIRTYYRITLTRTYISGAAD